MRINARGGAIPLKTYSSAQRFRWTLRLVHQNGLTARGRLEGYVRQGHAEAIDALKAKLEAAGIIVDAETSISIEIDDCLAKRGGA